MIIVINFITTIILVQSKFRTQLFLQLHCLDLDLVAKGTETCLPHKRVDIYFCTCFKKYFVHASRNIFLKTQEKLEKYFDCKSVETRLDFILIKGLNHHQYTIFTFRNHHQYTIFTFRNHHQYSIFTFRNHHQYSISYLFNYLFYTFVHFYTSSFTFQPKGT